MSESSQPRRKVWPLLLIIFACIGLAGLCWQKDFPPIADTPPRELAGVLTGPHDKIYCYRVGGFIDSTHCWRIHGGPVTIERVIAALALSPSETIPQEFWRLPPFYWPRKQSPGMVAYRSYAFTDDSRGSDGPHFFMIHDPSRHRAYVLFKDNF